MGIPIVSIDGEGIRTIIGDFQIVTVEGDVTMYGYVPFPSVGVLCTIPQIDSIRTSGDILI